MTADAEECQTCQAPLSWVDAAYSCALDCTFCPDCAEQYGHVCPNCSGELTMRARKTQPVGPRR
ncbi:MAG: DUF1272 domain-containing protein [bacterium]